MRKKKRAWRSVGLLAGFLLILCVHAIDAAPVSVEVDRVDLRGGEKAMIETCIDPAGDMRLADVMQSDCFHPEKKEIPGFGETTNSIWLRVTLSSEFPVARMLELQWPHIDELDVYAVHSQTLQQEWSTGVQKPFSQRPYPTRTFAFPLQLQAGETTIYLRAWAIGNLQMPMTVWEAEAFAVHDRRDQVVQGMYFGIIFVMGMYNLFLFFSFRDISYLYYVLYVVAFSLVQLGFTGTGFELFWPNLPYLQVRYFPLFTGLTLIFVFPFAREFLQSRVHAPIMDRLLQAMIVLGAIFVVMPFLIDPHIASRIATIATPIPQVIGIITAAVVYRRGFRPARYFLLAFGLLALAIVVTLMRSLELLPVSFFTENGMQIGSISEVILLSFALGDRKNTLKSERERILRGSLLQEQKLSMLRHELDAARRIQSSVLQKTIPRIEGLGVASRYMPMNHVGGDFFDCLQLGESEVCFIIADVSGHGVSAALIASMGQIAFDLQLERARRPEHVLLGMNDILHGRTGDYFLSASCVHIDAKNLKARIASAGHPALLLYHPSRESPLETRPRGRLIGPFPDPSVEGLDLDLLAGDRMLLFTDGITEARNGSGKMFGTRRLKEFLITHYEDAVETFADRLYGEVRRWIGTGQFDDDFTLLVIDVRRDGQTVVAVTSESAP